jgi:hypothetical protein
MDNPEGVGSRNSYSRINYWTTLSICLYEVDFFFQLPNPSGRSMALGSSQSVTEMSTRNLKKKRNLRVKGGRRVGLTTLPLSVSRLSK